MRSFGEVTRFKCGDSCIEESQTEIALTDSFEFADTIGRLKKGVPLCSFGKIELYPIISREVDKQLKSSAIKRKSRN